MTIQDLLGLALTEITQVAPGSGALGVVTNIAAIALRAKSGEISIPDADAAIKRLTGKFSADDQAADTYAKDLLAGGDDDGSDPNA